ncbi:MAG: hypothetical protein ABEJ62_02965 [Candidatus Nanohaloarchaea archaeon]
MNGKSGYGLKSLVKTGITDLSLRVFSFLQYTPVHKWMALSFYTVNRLQVEGDNL